MAQGNSKKITVEDIARLFEKPKIHTAELGEHHFTQPEPIKEVSNTPRCMRTL